MPLRISRDRVWLYGTAFLILAGLPFALLGWFREAVYRGDFAFWWSAGRNVGTRALIDAPRLMAWQSAHHVGREPFVYPPGFAWFYAPISHFQPLTFAILEASITVALLGVAGLAAARAYGFNSWFAIVAIFAWAPAVNAVEVGQSCGLSLALVMTLIWAIVRDRWVVVGMTAGALLYKPTIAVPIVLLLVVRARWRALAVVALCAFAWYLLSVQASHGDWSWPFDYERTIGVWLPLDFQGSALKAFSLPALLIALGVSWHIAFWSGAAILLAMLPRVANTRPLEAASVTPLLGLTTSVHAWPYEITLMLPAIMFAMTAVREPWRTRLVVAAYVLALLGMTLPYGSRLLAMLVLGATSLWLVGGARLSHGQAGPDPRSVNLVDQRGEGAEIPDRQMI
jgi:Glycosyltransferase family 87